MARCSEPVGITYHSNRCAYRPSDPRVSRDLCRQINQGGGNEGVKLRRAHDCGASDCYDELVLISHVELVKLIEPGVPFGIRFQGYDRSLDVVSGELYLSLRNGTYHGVRFAGEGELDIPRPGRFRANHREAKEIKSASEIVSCVSDDKGNIVWDGLLLFDKVANLAGFGVWHRGPSKGPFDQICGENSVELIDVLLGPIDLEQRLFD